MYPRSGGVYVFLRESFGPLAGFLWGWAMFWTMHSGIIAAVATIFARYAGYFVTLGDAGTRLVAIGVIVLLSAINWAGVRAGASLQAWFTAGKLVAIALMIAAGFLLGPREPIPIGVMQQAMPALPDSGGFLLALVAGLFAYGGWHMVTYSADETVDPRRTLPRALMVGVVTVTICYVALNGVYLYVLPMATVVTSSRIAADAADAVLGSGGGAMMSGLVMFSTFGALSGIILLGPRVYWAMAEDGLAFRWLGRIHEKHRTPHTAILLQCIWSSVLVATGTYRALFTRVIYTEWIFFGLMTVGLVLLRRRGVEASYRVPGYPVVPVLFAAAAFGIAVNQIIVAPRESVTGLSFVLAGIPVYWVWIRKRSERSTT
jgi:APA family basic amino acid/polyamine antiporter